MKNYSMKVLTNHDLILKKRFGISPEKHCLTAMPYRPFQGKLQNVCIAIVWCHYQLQVALSICLNGTAML